MNRFAIPLLGFAVLVAIFAVALKRAPEKTVVPSALIGKSAPDFTLPDLLQPDATVSMSTFRGRWVLVNVWGTWCRECQIEHPDLMDIAKGGKVTLVGLNYKDQDELAREWLSKLGNPYTAVAVDKQGDTAIDFGVYGAPETFLVDPQGIVVDKVVGVLTPEHWKDKMLPMIEGNPK